jgi:cytidylate kinase
VSAVGRLSYPHPVSDSPVAAASTSVTRSPAAGPARFAGVVALDGPSGTGKSTVARQLARRLGARYLDTGAMYRAATLAVLRAGVTPDDADAVVDVLRRVSIDVGTDPDHPGTRLSGQPVDREIRSDAVTGAVSAVAAIPAVRARLVARQRELITGATASGLADIAGIVVEGRDIGSVVWPQAELKIYLTASAEERAKRRARELAGSDLAAVQADLSRRDGLDSSRPVSPLQQAPGAVELDTTGIDVEGVVAEVLALIDARRHDR